MPEWWNWYTRRSQVPLLYACGFESHLWHQLRRRTVYDTVQKSWIVTAGETAICGYDGNGRHARFRFLCRKALEFEPPYPYHVVVSSANSILERTSVMIGRCRIWLTCIENFKPAESNGWKIYEIGVKRGSAYYHNHDAAYAQCGIIQWRFAPPWAVAVLYKWVSSRAHTVDATTGISEVCARAVG